jgi:hypothetical protein
MTSHRFRICTALLSVLVLSCGSENERTSVGSGPTSTSPVSSVPSPMRTSVGESPTSTGAKPTSTLQVSGSTAAAVTGAAASTKSSTTGGGAGTTASAAPRATTAVGATTTSQLIITTTQPITTTTQPIATTTLLPLTIDNPPAQRLFSDGDFLLAITGPAGTRLGSESTSVCTVNQNVVSPKSAGDCRVVARAPDGRTAGAMILIKRGTPDLRWSLAATTAISFAPIPVLFEYPPGTELTMIDLTPSTCTATKASVTIPLQGGTLGVCKVRVSTADTAEWAYTERELTTQLVEGVIVAAYDWPGSVASDLTVTVGIRLTAADTSLDQSVGVAGGFSCGNGFTSPYTFRPTAGAVDRTFSLRIGPLPVGVTCDLNARIELQASGGGRRWAGPSIKQYVTPGATSPVPTSQVP